MKLRVVHLYNDDTVSCILLDEGQDFDKLYREYDKQDRAMALEADAPDGGPGPATKAWLGFEDFMKKNGVKVIEFKEDDLS